MAFVNPSQRAPENAHHSWIGLRFDGEIVTAHCTCMAGLGEGCSDSATILFKIECATRNGYTSVTANQCQWNQIFSAKYEPAKIIDIKFAQPKLGNDSFLLESVQASEYQRLTPKSTEEQKKAFFLLVFKTSTLSPQFSPPGFHKSVQTATETKTGTLSNPPSEISLIPSPLYTIPDTRT